MKNIVFCINIILAVAAAGMIFYNIQEHEGTETEYTVKKSVKKSVEKKIVPPSILTVESDWKNRIIEQNLFDQNRNPYAQFGAGRANVQLSLVGVCDINGAKSAVIVQKTSNRGNRPFGPPMFQRQNNMQQSVQPQSSPQQYIRLGETLSNGYTLTEVSRDRAVLTRNGSRIELELQKASVSANTGNTTRQNRPNAIQQVQQMQHFQNMQMMRMMRMMQQNNQNNQNNMGGSRGGYSRRMNGGMMPAPR